MSEHITINASVRTDLGKGASRRLRRIEGLIPSVMYGNGEPAQSLSVPHKDILKAADNEAFFSSIIDLNIDGAVSPVLLKDLQRHPAKPSILHADFQRVDMAKEIHVHVPLHFINEEQCHGVKMEGGRIQHNLIEIEISCLPGKLPEYIDVDMTDVSIGDILHISDLTLPEGVASLALSHGEDHDLPIVSIAANKGEDTDENESGGEGEEDGAAASEEDAG